MEKQEKIEPKQEEIKEKHEETCPICGSENIVPASRCKTCMDCGWSLCSM